MKKVKELTPADIEAMGMPSDPRKRSHGASRIKHRAGGMYLYTHSAFSPALTMLVRVRNGVIAIAMADDLNRQCCDSETPVQSYCDITEEEMKEIFTGGEYKFLGTFPNFRWDSTTEEVLCTKS